MLVSHTVGQMASTEQGGNGWLPCAVPLDPAVVRQVVRPQVQRGDGEVHICPWAAQGSSSRRGNKSQGRLSVLVPRASRGGVSGRGGVIQRREQRGGARGVGNGEIPSTGAVGRMTGSAMGDFRFVSAKV